MPLIANCAGCPYRAFGPAVGSRGSDVGPIAIVGEAPGKTEIATGWPFWGAAGEVLGRALQDATLDESGILITNAVACRPFPIRPRVTAIKACHERLEADLAGDLRSVVIALGATAIRAVTGLVGFRVMASRGRPLPSLWGTVVPTLHPARVLRRPAEYHLLVEDLELAATLAWPDGSWLRSHNADVASRR